MASSTVIIKLAYSTVDTGVENVRFNAYKTEMATKAHTVPPATGTDRQSGGPALGLGTGPGLGTRVPADDRDWH